MLKKTIRYTDFNDKEIEKVCYFHISKSELVELEVSRPGGMQAWIQKVIDSDDGKTLMAEFKDIILKSYGKRSADGSGFIKSDELRQEFYSSQAYDALFMELMTNAEAAAAFINGIIPANLQAEMAKLTPAQGGPELRTEGRLEDSVEAAAVPPEAGPVKGYVGGEEKNVFQEPAEDPGPRQLTRAEIVEMDPDELKAGLATGAFVLP